MCFYLQLGKKLFRSSNLRFAADAFCLPFYILFCIGPIAPFDPIWCRDTLTPSPALVFFASLLLCILVCILAVASLLSAVVLGCCLFRGQRGASVDVLRLALLVGFALLLALVGALRNNCAAKHTSSSVVVMCSSSSSSVVVVVVVIVCVCSRRRRR